MDLRMRLASPIPSCSAARLSPSKLLLESEETFAEPLSSQDLAESVHLSKRQLERLFLKYLGRSPASITCASAWNTRVT